MLVYCKSQININMFEMKQSNLEKACCILYMMITENACKNVLITCTIVRYCVNNYRRPRYLFNKVDFFHLLQNNKSYKT